MYAYLLYLNRLNKNKNMNYRYDVTIETGYKIIIQINKQFNFHNFDGDAKNL